jgi:L-threonylcarbamoyladenylate synthase
MNQADIARAAEILRAGGLVAFPTETVYGLGANALDPRAVGRIFEVKQRPAASPLIVHVDSREMARELVTDWPDAAGSLACAFWPGPLTLVLPKSPSVPDIVTAGLATVALRQPDHPVAAALIARAGVPIAAPSANRFSTLSPTTAEHVLKSLGGKIDLILDGGPSRLGIESTVVSLAGPRPRLLRPGAISREQIEELVGDIESAAGVDLSGAHPSPGLHLRHYSPSTPLYLIDQGRLPSTGRGACLWLFDPLPAAVAEQMPAEAAAYAAVLYETLHRLDEMGLDWIAVERPPEWPEWAAVRDRLERASARIQAP